MMAIAVGSQVFAALVIGLLLAFALQLLLTNLGVVVGVVVLKSRLRSMPETSLQPSPSSNESESDDLVMPIGLMAGVGMVLSVNTVLFIASFLAVRFSLAADAIAGAILGLVIWSAYFLIVSWIGSTAAASLLGSVVSSVVGAVQRLVFAARALLKGSSDTAAPLTEEAVTELIRQQVQTTLTSDNLQTWLEEYLKTLIPSRAEVEPVQATPEALIARLELTATQKRLLQQVDRSALVQYLGDRTSLSAAEIEKLVDRLQTLEPQQEASSTATPCLQTALTNWLTAATANAIPLADWLAQEGLADAPNEFDRPNALNPSESLQKADSLTPTPPPPEPSTPLSARLRRVDLQRLKSAVLNRVDLSDLDVAQLWNQVQALQHQLWGASSAEEAKPYEVIWADVEAYVLTTFPWRLCSPAGWAEFRDVLYDSEAAPEQVRHQLEAWGRNDLLSLLQQRSDLDPAQMSDLADRLASVRQAVLATVQAAEAAEVAQMGDRPGIPLIDASVAEMSDLWQQLSDYLRYTQPSRLTPEKVERKITDLAESARAIAQSRHQSLPALDRAALEQLLQRRKTVTPEQATAILLTIDRVWNRAIAQMATGEPPSALDQVIEAIAPIVHAYLKGEISRDAVQTRVLAVLTPPHGSEMATRRWLAAVNWDEVRDRLRLFHGLGNGSVDDAVDDMDVDRAIQQVRAGLQPLMRWPRRWAVRSPYSMADFVATLTDFLQHADLSSLSQEHLLTQLHPIWQQAQMRLAPRAASLIEALPELASLDYTVLRQHLANRTDLPAELLHTLGDRLESALRHLIDPLQAAPPAVESVMDAIGAAWQTLTATEWDQTALRQEMSRLMQGSHTQWQSLQQAIAQWAEGTPLDEISQQVSQWSYDTLVTLLQSSQRLSETLSGQALEQVQGVQSYIQQQLETVKQHAQEQAQTLRQHALDRLEATRRAIATAALWLLTLALTSAITSAVAGVLAVMSLGF